MGTTRVLGTDLLEGHGSFGTDADPYFTINTGWTILGGVASFNNATGTNLTRAGAATVGKTYEIVFTYTAGTGSVRPQIGSAVGTFRSAPGTYTEILTAATNGNCSLAAFNGANFSSDDWTIREVTYKKTSRSNLAPSNKLSL